MIHKFGIPKYHTFAIQGLDDGHVSTGALDIYSAYRTAIRNSFLLIEIRLFIAKALLTTS
jgi:hypothetical protein